MNGRVRTESVNMYCRQWWRNPSRKFRGGENKSEKYVTRRVYEEMGAME
jgi:hypothetical protein